MTAPSDERYAELIHARDHGFLRGETLMDLLHQVFGTEELLPLAEYTWNQQLHMAGTGETMFKSVECTRKREGALFATYEVEIEPLAGKAATDELRAALALVDKYRLAAYKAAGHRPSLADWTMVDFAVKTDRVLVKIDAGAAG